LVQLGALPGNIVLAAGAARAAPVKNTPAKSRTDLARREVRKQRTKLVESTLAAYVTKVLTIAECVAS